LEQATKGKKKTMGSDRTNLFKRKDILRIIKENSKFDNLQK
jgi:hypothetical protein